MSYSNNFSVIIFKNPDNLILMTGKYNQSIPRLNPKNIFLMLIMFNILAIYSYAKSESRSEIKYKAKKGDREAQLKLGKLYLEGDERIKPDNKKAFHWISQSAEQEFPPAQYYIAQCYEDGIGVDVDLEKSLSFLIKAAEQGVEPAQSKAAAKLIAKNDFDKAAKYLQMSSEQGNIDSSRKLGQLFLQTEGKNQDLLQAIKYLGRAAESGDSQAMLLLANLYSGENGLITPDYTKMIQYLWEAAGKNFPEAQTKLGECFEDGFGLTKDTQMAVKWYKKAAGLNDVKAMINLGNCYAMGKGQSMDQKQAFYWYTKAAEMSDPTANYHLGICYADGIGVAKNQKISFTHFLNAAKAGIADAQYRVGNCYKYGIGTHSDLDEAKKWFIKAVEQDHVPAEKNLKMLLLDSYDSANQYKKDIYDHSIVDPRPAQ